MVWEAMIGGRSVTSGSTGESRFSPELPCERRSGPAEPSPGTPKLSGRPEGKPLPSARLIQDLKPFPDLVSVLQKGSQFRSNRDLGRG